MTRLFLALLLLLGTANLLPGAVRPARAVAVDEHVLGDPALEARARALMKQLRCLVCQNQSIEESNADLARDLRQIVRERVGMGESDRQVLDYLVARYGDWVLLKPPLEERTLVLWFGPLVLLGLGGLAVVVFFRRRRGAIEPAAPLDDAECQTLKHLLHKDNG
jgi:cytochrome c-type biogenesis protein CcmH